MTGRLLLLAEGGVAPDPRGFGDEFQSLWTTVLRRVGLGSRSIVVVGFHKGHVESLDPQRARYEPLDLLISTQRARVRAGPVVVAFDREPPLAGAPTAKRCQEVRTLTRNLVEHSRFQRQDHDLRDASRALAVLYATEQPSAPRPPTRPPRMALELLCMEPSFEGLLLADPSAVRTALGLHGKRTEGWPGRRAWSERASADPSRTVLTRAIECARDHDTRAWRAIQRPFLTAKHAWAELILRDVPGDSQVWRHPIATRLRLVCDSF